MNKDRALAMTGMALRAGKLQAGEEPAAAACKARACRLLLTARDAAGNTLRRAAAMAEEGQCLTVALPYTREELGAALGRGACAVAAVTDLGLAQAIVERLAEAEGEAYGPLAEKLRLKAERAAQRRSSPARKKRK